METYKLMMRVNDGVLTEMWSVMDTFPNNKEAALEALKNYRKSIPARKFRLELHTVTVLDD